MSPEVREVLREQYEHHPRWTYQLHSDNLAVCCEVDPKLGPAPSYASVHRFMKENGWFKIKHCRSRDTEAARRAAERLQSKEVRSFEAEYVHGLWHLDFHQCSRSILTPSGEWIRPWLLCIIDDRSRVVCHMQWYTNETAEFLVHGFSQAIQKRGLPRALMSDNGSAMKAAEFVQGLERLSIAHEPTLEYSPYQNGKQENFFGQVEGRLIPMTEGVKELSLAELNEATQAWLELEYHHSIHSEIKQKPIERLLDGPSVGRDSPSSDALRSAFRMRLGRKQRRSDGTMTAFSIRFEVPSRFRTMERLTVRCARWNLSSIELVDPRDDRCVLATLYPLDKTKNAEGKRKSLEPVANAANPDTSPVESGMAPLLSKYITEYAATGLPPAYVPQDTSDNDDSRRISR